MATCWYAYIAIPAGIADAGRQSRRARAQIAGRTLAVEPITSGVPVETTAVANDAFCRMAAGEERNFGGRACWNGPFFAQKMQESGIIRMCAPYILEMQVATPVVFVGKKFSLMGKDG